MDTLATPSRLLPVHGDDIHGLRHAADVHGPRFGDREPATRSRLAARDDLATLGQAGDARGLVHALAGEIPSHLCRPGRVHADPNLRGESGSLAMVGQLALDR